MKGNILKEIKLKINEIDLAKLKIVATFNEKNVEHYIIDLINKDLCEIGIKQSKANRGDYKNENSIRN